MTILATPLGVLFKPRPTWRSNEAGLMMRSKLFWRPRHEDIPDNFEAQQQRLEWLNQEAQEISFDDDQGHAGSFAETEINRLSREYGDRPTFVYWMAELDRESAEQHYDSFLLRFPHHPLAERVARSRAMLYLRQGRTDQSTKALRDIVENYPTGRLAHRAFRDMMFFASRSDPQMALSLADSLLAGDLKLLTHRVTRSDPISIIAGIDPKAVSFCVKTDLLSDQGRFDQSASTIDAMVQSEVGDPHCYLYVGERLLGLAQVTFGEGSAYPARPRACT